MRPGVATAGQVVPITTVPSFSPASTRSCASAASSSDPAGTTAWLNAPASILAAIGLWTLRRFGYLASYFVAGFYIYASVYIFVEVITGGPPYPVEIVIPQVLAILAAVALLIYPARHRARFR